jgi:two-component system sensor histidine kinase DegS
MDAATARDREAGTLDPVAGLANPGPEPLAPDTQALDAETGSFEALHAEAKFAIGQAANTMRRVRDNYREALSAQQAQWRDLRDELDALERRRLDQLRPLAIDETLPVAGGSGAAAGVIDSGLVGPDETVPGVDASRVRSIRATLEVLGDDLATRLTELGRIEIAVRNLESTWLFLERDDTSLIGTDSSLGSGAAGDDQAMPGWPAVQMRIVEAQEAERARLAQEIHDGPAQALANAIFQVEFVERVVDREPGMARHELRFLRELLRRELGDVRGFITQLRPPVLAELGLEGAIGDAIEHMRALTGLTIDAEIQVPTEALDDTEQTVVLRVVQEALQNVRKHASASKVTVAARPKGSTWVLEIRDNGRGFDVASAAARGRRNFGLQFMRERAELIGARLDVRSGKDGGTVVRLAIPMGEEESK